MKKKGNSVRRSYKDGIFRSLFNDPEKLSELYYALSGCETDSSEIDIVTLEDAVFDGIKNDLAFTVGLRLIVLIEHQSTDSPNLPVRMLCYLAEEYKRILDENNVYGTGLVSIPAPELYVFYNGKPKAEKEWILKLSDAFADNDPNGCVEVIVKVIDINYGNGADILKKCKTLEGYSLLLDKAQTYFEETGDKQFAMEESIRECLEEGILTDFLRKNRGDVMNILNFTLTEEQRKNMYLEEGRRKGMEEGREEGRETGHEEMICALKLAGFDVDQLADATGWSRERIESL